MNAPEMIRVGDVGPDAALFIGEGGTISLRIADQLHEVDAKALTSALTRAKPVAALVARATVPISGMSVPMVGLLTRFGCTRVPAEADAR